MPIGTIVIIVLIAFIVGYIVKDVITIERKVEVTVKKQKIKGAGNQIDNDLTGGMEEKRNIFKRLFHRKKDK